MDELRKKIDDVDARIIKLLARRLRFSKRIGNMKKEQSLAIKDGERETSLLHKVCELAAAEGLDKSYVEEIYKLILKESRSRQEIP